MATQRRNERGAGRLTRLERLQQGLSVPLLLVNLPGIHWLTGFTGSFAVVLVFPDRVCFITDRRYAEQSALEVLPGFEILFLEAELPLLLARLLKGCPEVQVEESMTLARHRTLGEGVSGTRFVPVPSPVTALRRFKDRDEVAGIEAALRLTEEVMVYTAGLIRPGMREREVAAAMEHYARIKGAEGASFPTIVASGPRSSLPHGEASDRVIAAGELVLLDFGFIIDGYCSDFTRVLWTGSKVPPRIRRVWSLVAEAQQTGFAALKSGVPAAEPDLLVRDFFRKARVLARYEHSLGHGVGREIHEAPRLSYRSEEVLEAGMVVTVEPGLYYPGKFGIRLEDMALVTATGARRLTDFPLEIACTG